MYKISVVIFQRLLLVASIALLVACGGGNGTGSSTEQSLPQTAPAAQSQLFVTGAGIKGPLAFASVELYALDTRFGQLYDPEHPIGAATTNAYAEITGLAIPADTAPPYILIIDGTNAIDLNTGVAPVIRKMITIITQESLDSGKPVYATPYTTLAYQMLRLESPGGGSQVSSLNDPSIGNYLVQFNQDIIQAIGFRVRAETDIFTTPPIITADSTSIEEQQMVIHYRAAIEALSSLLYKMSLSSDPTITTDSLLERLALDLHSDSVIDNSAGGQTIGGIDTVLLSQNPMRLDIPNTSYLVRDTVQMMDEERSLVGSSSNIEFLVNDIAVTLEPALLSSQLDSTQEVDYTEPVGNTAGTLLLTGLIASAPPVGGEVLFSHDFNGEALHTYTADDIRTTWNNARPALKPGAVKIVKDPDPSGAHGNSMQVFYAANSAGHRNNSGSEWFMDIGAHDELYFAYDIYFEDDAEFVKGGKLPGLDSVDYRPNAGVPADGTDRWSGTLVWKDDGKIANYAYHANQARIYGDVVWWNNESNGQAYFKRGAWSRVEVYYKINTPGVLDGRIQGWINGKLALDTTKIMFRMPGGEHLKIGTLRFATFYGGNGSSFAPSTDQHIYFDNFVVSTQPITH